MTEGAKPIPPSRLLRAGRLALVLGAVVLLPMLARDAAAGRITWEPFLASVVVAGVGWLFILLMISMIEAGRDWRRRGGKPDPFIRE